MAVDNEIQLDQLARSFAAVGVLIDAIQSDQWSVPTQCMDWTVHRLVEHLVGKNLVFSAVLAEQPPPQRGDGLASDQLARLYRESAAALLDAFGQPDVLDRSYQGPLGAATGAQRLKIRMYDLLAHGWDLAQALGRQADLPEDAAEESLTFARADGRAVRPGGGCFGPPRHVAAAAPAIVRLVAFLGRDVSAA
ncbi:MAG: TIGR03086 family metal-binding protein [Jatrophihabitans sp.]